MTDCAYFFRNGNGMESSFNRSTGSVPEDYWKGTLYKIIVPRHRFEESEIIRKWVELMRTEFAVQEGLEVKFWDEIDGP